MMKARTILLASLATIFFTACSNNVSIEVTTDVLNADYLGNGVEWDPYDEALSWGCEMSDSDWDTLFSRLDFMKPQYVRCMINSPFTYYDGKGYDDERNSLSLKKLLGYCQSRGVMVVFGEYNPPTWELKGSQEWVEASVKHLNWLVQENGFDCIKHFVCFNEPDGNWASTNGDFQFWREMVARFHTEMQKYPGLSDKVSIAGPDAVIGYKNPASEYDAAGWLKACVRDIPEIGIYDMHAYPGQNYVRSGAFQKELESLKAIADKPVILGETGFKYFSDPADSHLAEEYRRRVEGHPFTKGSDCNMLVYDDFYALDMPILLCSVMNSGFSGAAAWMLDDAMHSNGDSGKTEDIKLWGMWNILGSEVFGDPSQEEVRPWYYTWSLMCRNFPAGSDILRTKGKLPKDMAITAAITPEGTYSVALVNWGSKPRNVSVSLPAVCEGYCLQLFKDYPVKSPLPEGNEQIIEIPAETFAIISKE